MKKKSRAARRKRNKYIKKDLRFDNNLGNNEKLNVNNCFVDIENLKQDDFAEQYGLVAYDECLLEKSRAQWQFGDWQSLIKLDRILLQNHPDRAKLALLAAAAHMQLGNNQQTRQYVRLASDWGCGKKLISQLLVSGAYNTLGRLSAINNQEQKAINYFETAISLVLPKTDARIIGQNRIIRETAKLGLLPQAARLISNEINEVKNSAVLDAARLKILQTEVELIHHELSLAHQRQQLYGTPRTVDLIDAESESSQVNIEKLKQKSVSQLGQDIWVLEKTNFKKGGFFVEFGATDGVLLSNSWLLEKEFDWQGICAEPNPKFYEQLKVNRNCILSPACITGQTGKKVEFILADAYGGSFEYADDDQHSDKRAAYKAAGHVLDITGISLNDFLIQQNAPREIDYISIDTEGSEFEILEHFPFDQWKIRLLTIEHNFTARRGEIRKLMELNGYYCTEQQWDDWYELKSKVIGSEH